MDTHTSEYSRYFSFAFTELDPISKAHFQFSDIDCSGFTYGGHCFWSVMRNSRDMNYNEAKAECSKDGRSRLADIYSKDHYDKAKAYLHSQKPEFGLAFIAAWTGMTRDIPVSFIINDRVGPYALYF